MKSATLEQTPATLGQLAKDNRADAERRLFAIVRRVAESPPVAKDAEQIRLLLLETDLDAADVERLTALCKRRKQTSAHGRDRRGRLSYECAS